MSSGTMANAIRIGPRNSCFGRERKIQRGNRHQANFTRLSPVSHRKREPSQRGENSVAYSETLANRTAAIARSNDSPRGTSSEIGSSVNGCLKSTRIEVSSMRYTPVR